MKHIPIYLTLILAFILGTHDGYVALWRSPGGEPDQVFPYSVSSLPPADQKQLEEGIVIESKEGLLALMEDYLS